MFSCVYEEFTHVALKYVLVFLRSVFSKDFTTVPGDLCNIILIAALQPKPFTVL